MDRFDVAIIGAGPGGYVCAIRAAQLGLKVALVEKRQALGGTCLNVGCIPSKALLESSELYAATRERLEEHGVGVGEVGLDLERMMARKERIVSELTAGVEGLITKNRVTRLLGKAALGPGPSVAVTSDEGEETIEATSVVLAMGSLPVQIPTMPFDGERVISSTEALALRTVPKRLLVVGAGAVGLELGSVWARLGAEVTVVEMLPTVTPFADRQLAKALERALTGQGLDLRLSTRVTEARVDDEGVVVTVEDGAGGQAEVACDRVLVAVGRRPCTEGAGLEAAGVELDEQGRVAIDDGFRTSVEGVYAIGDLVRGPMLAHKAEEEGIALAERLAGQPGHVNYHAIPNVVYTDPELAAVGRTEAELKEDGVPYRTGRFTFRANGRARSLGAETGMVKILAHAETDRILGVHMLGPRVSELVAEATVAIELVASAEDLARTCHAHPTLSEVVREAALAVDKRAIHS